MLNSSVYWQKDSSDLTRSSHCNTAINLYTRNT